ncbi:MAG TPA: hypothetical protein VKP69_08390, partial [Isosphaeraceae bacterium]|nr:hypothetical protein [Isosphaeraceae bacterium]
SCNKAIQLTKIKNNFADPKVNFTRYELLKLLGWPDQKQHYRRLDDSLRRWVGVTLRYDRSWWDNEVKCRVDANFHILDSVVLFDQEVRRTLRARHQPLPLSSFTWNRVFFESCRAGNLKSLDVTTYFGLRSAISKQMYRFLDKRFYLRSDWCQWTRTVRNFGTGEIAMSDGGKDARQVGRDEMNLAEWGICKS